MFNDDKLEALFAKQLILQMRLGYLKGNKWKQNYANLMAIGIMEELSECMRETPWKPWKKSATYNQEKFKEELVDLWHFVINLTLASGMDADELYQRFVEKNEKNHKRQDHGY